MKSNLRVPHPPAVCPRRVCVRVACAVLLALLCGAGGAQEAWAQQRFSRTYPARRNVRLQLSNRSGTVEVEGWQRGEIKVTATMESPAARLAPLLSDDGLVIDIERDNTGRHDLGDVNFRIHVPYECAVDVETMRGNITVRNVRGPLLRAYVTTSGDLELTGIRAFTVMARNTTGDILFDAELMRGGNYELNSTDGNINLRITAGSGFTLTATAPRTRNINLGDFARIGSFDFQGGNRKVVGRVGDGGATLTTFNQRGNIFFALR